jgi:hypothetical protein
MVSLLALFLYLQLLDLLSTLAFLAAGGREINPLINVLMLAAGSPLGGLVAAKLMALSLGLWCWRGGRLRLLERTNVFYAALVAWNLVAFLVNVAGSRPA